jgi:uncharacterized protein YdhG (YjbR/CyaY superfamily)
MASTASVDDYIDSFPSDVQSALRELRAIVRERAPTAVESISYRIPAYKLDGRALVYFAAWTDHVSMYPIPEIDERFEHDIEPYRAGKGTLHFALSEPLPRGLVERLVDGHVVRVNKTKRRRA